VNGQQVTQKELVDGYMRRSDYTQKTQQVASQREQNAVALAMAEAAQKNPLGLAQSLLGDQYTVLPRQEIQAPQQRPWTETAASVNAAPPQDELMARLERLEQARVAEEESNHIEQVAAEMRRLDEAYGDDFDPDAVVALGMATNRRSAADLEALHFELRGRATAAAKAAAAKAAAPTAGADSTPTVSTVSGEDRQAQTEAASREARLEMSFEESLMAALETGEVV
jgi:hypothetical protein